MRSDAQMEINSDQDQDNDNQQFFIKENALYSETDYQRSQATSEVNIAVHHALYSDLQS